MIKRPVPPPSPWPLAWWGTYWQYEMIILPLFVMVLTTVWFWWGGVRDLIRPFQRLKPVKRSDHNDGMVVNHRNLDDYESPGETPAPPPPEPSLAKEE